MQTPAAIMRECKQREKRRKGGARSMRCRGNEKRSICSFLFCSSLHPAAYISHGPVKVKRHQLLGGYLLASQCDIKTVTFLIQRERQKNNNIDWRRSKQAATQLALHDLRNPTKLFRSVFVMTGRINGATEDWVFLGLSSAADNM